MARAAIRQHGAGVGVRGGDHDVRAGNPAAPGDFDAGLLDKRACRGDEIEGDKRDAVGSVVQHQRLGEEVVGHALRSAGVVISGHRRAFHGVDPDLCGAGACEAGAVGGERIPSEGGQQDSQRKRKKPGIHGSIMSKEQGAASALLRPRLARQGYRFAWSRRPWA